VQDDAGGVDQRRELWREQEAQAAQHALARRGAVERAAQDGGALRVEFGGDDRGQARRRQGRAHGAYLRVVLELADARQRP
jgi:hypothetical protein